MINIRLLPPLPGYEANADGLFHLPGTVNFLGNHEWYVHIRLDLEPGEDSQYPLGDILDKYLLTASDVVDQTISNWTASDTDTLDLVLIGEPENLRLCITDIIGHRVYNEDFTLLDGRQAIRLVISPS